MEEERVNIRNRDWKQLHKEKIGARNRKGKRGGGGRGEGGKSPLPHPAGSFVMEH